MAAESLLEQVRLRAYEIWLSEGCPVGRDRIHWLRAEAEFRERLVTRSGFCFGGLHEPPAPDRFARAAQGDSESTSSNRNE